MCSGHFVGYYFIVYDMPILFSLAPLDSGKLYGKILTQTPAHRITRHCLVRTTKGLSVTKIAKRDSYELGFKLLLIVAYHDYHRERQVNWRDLQKKFSI